MDRLQVNAAVEQLIESHGADKDARATVYAFGKSLPPVSRLSGSVETEVPGTTFHACTPEQGDIQAQDEDKDVKTFTFGGLPERIGLYKIWREPDRRGRFKIRIAHFWKLDEGTESETEPPQQWCLACDPNGPIWFGEWSTRTVWDHFGLQIDRHEFIEQWGRNLEKRHPGGWSIRIFP